MLQAEVGSAKITPAHSYPTRGQVVHDFTLPSTDGKRISLQDYRGHFSLVLIFAGDPSQITEKKCLSELVQRYSGNSRGGCRGVASPGVFSRAGGSDQASGKTAISGFS